MVIKQSRYIRRVTRNWYTSKIATAHGITFKRITIGINVQCTYFTIDSCSSMKLPMVSITVIHVLKIHLQCTNFSFQALSLKVKHHYRHVISTVDSFTLSVYLSLSALHTLCIHYILIEASLCNAYVSAPLVSLNGLYKNFYD